MYCQSHLVLFVQSTPFGPTTQLQLASTCGLIASGYKFRGSAKHWGLEAVLLVQDSQTLSERIDPSPRILPSTLRVCSFQPTCSERNDGCVLELSRSRKSRRYVPVVSTTCNENMDSSMSPILFLFSVGICTAQRPPIDDDDVPVRGASRWRGHRQSTDIVRDDGRSG